MAATRPRRCPHQWRGSNRCIVPSAIYRCSLLIRRRAGLGHEDRFKSFAGEFAAANGCSVEGLGGPFPGRQANTAKRVPRNERTPETPLSCPASVRRSLPDLLSQIFTLASPSPPAEARRVPSGLNATRLTQPVCPL